MIEFHLKLIILIPLACLSLKIIIKYNQLNADVQIIFYNLIKFDNIPNVKPSDFKETNEYKNIINLCFTNAKRMEINYIKMKE